MFEEGFDKFTLDLLLEQVNSSVKNKRLRAYCDIIVCYPETFDKISKILDFYSNRSRSSWNVSIAPLGEEDFYIVSFRPKEESNKKPVFFFWKALRDRNYVTILSIGLQNYAITRNSLDSLVHCTKRLWFAWLGTHFLENMDNFVRQVLGDKTIVLASFQTIVLRDKFFPKKIRVYPLPPRGFVPLEDIRNQVREKYQQQSREINKFSNVRYKVICEEKSINFLFSITDRARITFEYGDFTLFILLLRPLITESRKILDILRRNSFSSLTESTQEGKRIEIASYDLIEALVFKKSKEAKNWFTDIITLFSSDIPQEKLLNFTLMSGNPYFLAHIIDTENSSSIYLSATDDEMQILPAAKKTSENTIAKIIDLLQTKIDPNIAIQRVERAHW